MGDYDYCAKHDTSFLMPDLLMCPTCAFEALKNGAVREPLGDALLDYISALRAERDVLEARLRSRP